MAEKREISKEYAAIGAALIRQRDELRHLESATIIYLESEHEKKRNKKKVLGLCEKVQDKNKWAIPADFTITFYKPNIAALTEEQKVAVVYHELLHVGWDEEEGASIIPHDTEDFMAVLELFGVRWNVPGAEIMNRVMLREAMEEAGGIMLAEEVKEKTS